MLVDLMSLIYLSVAEYLEREGGRDRSSYRACYVFSRCFKLRRVPEKLYRGETGLRSILIAFSMCFELRRVPEEGG